MEVEKREEGNVVEVVEIKTKESVVAEVKATIHIINEVALTGAIAIGNNLKELKELVPHGGWLEYIEENLNFSTRKTQRFIKIAEAYGEEESAYSKAISNTTAMSHLSVTNALQLLSLEETQVEAFAEEVKIDEVNTRELEEEIKKWKEEHKEAKAQISLFKEELEEVNERLKEAEAKKEDVDKKQLEDLEKQKEELEEKTKKLEAKGLEEKNKNNKLKEQLNQINKKAEEEKKQALEELKEELKSNADAEAKEKYEAKIEAIEKERDRAIKSSNGQLMKFKFITDEIRGKIIEVQDLLETVEDKDQKEKMEMALKQTLTRWV